jgi:hypothetical protein
MHEGTANPKIAVTMTRLRPMESATDPTQGDASAIAMVTALTVKLVASAEAENIRRNSGSNG